MGLKQGIAQHHIELIVIDIMQKHIHTSQIIGRVIDFLPKKSLFDDMLIKLLFGLQ